LSITWSEIQFRRLKELNAGETHLKKSFADVAQRDRAYQKLENELVKRERQRLKEFREVYLRPGLCRLESRLIETLVKHDFVQVITPIIMSKGLLSRMTIEDGHPLAAQIFWIDDTKCLRPMLAPHLYYVLQDLIRLWDKPVRIFEVGPCFRKESKGAHHSIEFTMLNLVEMGLPKEKRESRIEELAAVVMETAKIGDYTLQPEKSEIYGDTIDIIAGKDKVEVASGAMGPHPLDSAWRINDTWVGIGFGLERLLMVAENSKSLGKMGRSLAYLNGIRLNI
jgi:phenylalanyl-tRNA synthetase alpha chain